jgi:hypothetical protein
MAPTGIGVLPIIPHVFADSRVAAALLYPIYAPIPA